MNVEFGKVEIFELLNYIDGDNFLLPSELKMKNPRNDSIERKLSNNSTKTKSCSWR